MRTWVRNILCTAALSAFGTSAFASLFSTEVILDGGTSLGVITFPGASSGPIPVACPGPFCQNVTFTLTVPSGPIFSDTTVAGFGSDWDFDTTSHQLTSLTFGTNSAAGILSVSLIGQSGSVVYSPIGELEPDIFGASFQPPVTAEVPNPAFGTLFLAGALAGLALHRRRLG